MRKNFILLISLLLAILSLAGNANAGPGTSAYSIKTETYTIDTAKLGVKIEYPQIVNLGDRELQERINALILSEAVPVNFFHRLSNDKDGRHFSMHLRCEITWQSDRLLSIRFAGSSYGQGAPYPPREFYTLNIDMVKGKKLLLRDLIVINENFAEKFRAEGIKTVSPHPGRFTGKQVFADFTPFKTGEDTIRLFNDADELSPEGYRPGTYCYFTPDSFGISTSVAHAIGDHADFEIKYEDIAENIKADNEVWRDFFPRAGKNP